LQKVTRTEQANEDLFQVWYYIAIENQSPENADRFIDALDETLYFLAKNPFIGTIKNHYADGIRQFVFQKYLIFYFPIEDGIEVVRILHGARDIGQQFND
jgi:toxin ParE1/3/4